MDTSIEWQVKAELDARFLLSEINDVERFRQIIASRVIETRRLRHLPPVQQLDF